MINEDQFSQHVGNVVQAASNATPSERRAGARWYGRAHRDAVHSGQDIMPGVKLNHPSGNGQQSSPTGLAARVKYRKENPDTDMADLIRDKRNSPETKRAAAEIAATSPASPSGMDWEKNSQAAYEAARMTTKQYRMLKATEEAVHGEQLARGAIKKAKNRGEPTDALDATRSAALAQSRNLSGAAREPFKGKASAFAGNRALIGAYEIHHGIKEPAQVLSPLKTGHFAEAVAHPQDAGPEGITVDEHMANILGGRTKWQVHRPDAPARPNERTIGDVGKPANYQYSKKVIAAGAEQMGNANPLNVQATAWIHEKNDKNRREGGGQSAQDKARNTINRNVSNRLAEGIRGL